MRWSERQVAMLEAMGVRLWRLPAAAANDTAAVAVADVPAPNVRAEPQPTVARVLLPAVGRAGAPAVGHVGAPAVGRAGAPAVGRADSPVVAGFAAPDARAEQHVGAPAAQATPFGAELRRTVAACTACALCEGRTQAVFGSGPSRADWMVVGETPGEAEDRDGTPFAGASGVLLDNMLRAIGVSRSAAGPVAEPARQAFVTNVLKCRPPADRQPTPEEFARCEAHLVGQIELVRPRLLLAMGRFAVSMLLRSSEPIGRLRGRVHRYRGLPLVVTYHPSVLLRNLEEKAKAWDDLCLAVEALGAEGAG